MTQVNGVIPVTQTGQEAADNLSVDWPAVS
jgi:hypothetical protein